MQLKRYAIIVAGGKGQRMNSSIPKQFMELKGIPVLMRTVSAFFLADSSIEIVLVLPEIHHNFWDELVERYNFVVPHRKVVGGGSRFQSVKNGLKSITAKNGIVAVHDGVRPLVTSHIINKSYAVAETDSSAIAVVPSKDSIRVKTALGSESVDRNNYFLVQTPQSFDLATLKAAYDQYEKPSFTDDASVFEEYGKTISLIDGDYKNIKITTPEDLVIAECFIKI